MSYSGQFNIVDSRYTRFQWNTRRHMEKKENLTNLKGYFKSFHLCPGGVILLHAGS